MVADFVTATGLGFGFSYFGAKLDGWLFDRAAPLLGRPQPAKDIVVVLLTEKDYQQAATPLALWGLHLTPFFNKLAKSKARAVGLDMVLPRFPLARFVLEHDRGIFKAMSRLKKTTRLVSGFGVNQAGMVKGPFLIYQKIQCSKIKKLS